jgi:hypothetical protein
LFAICVDFSPAQNIIGGSSTFLAANPAKLTETDFSEFIILRMAGHPARFDLPPAGRPAVHGMSPVARREQPGWARSRAQGGQFLSKACCTPSPETSRVNEKVQSNALDRLYLLHWARELGVSDLLERAMSDAGF